jgi:hypothetical protein
MPTQTAINLDNLLRVLNVATDKNALHWNKTADEDTFRSEFGLGTVRIAMVPEASRYVLSLIDRNGILLDEYRPSGEGELIVIENLYKKVRRQALDLDAKLKSVYDQLKKLAGES